MPVSSGGIFCVVLIPEGTHLVRVPVASGGIYINALSDSASEVLMTGSL